MGLTVGHDVVVVGSGAGGAAAAWRLCSSGLRVLLIEAGPAFDPATDYPLDQPGWERRGFPDKPGSRALISYGDLGTLDPDFADLASWSRAGFPWRLPEGAPRPPSVHGYAHVMGLGGSTLHFVGEAHRLHPDAFDLHRLTGSGADWPVSYAELDPYYQIAEEITGVAGEGGEDGRWRSRPLPLPAHPFSPGALALRSAGARLGQVWQVNPRAALSQPYQDRPACNYCGQCSRGCPLGDKGSVDVTFLRQAMASGKLTVMTDTTVTRLHTGPNGTITHIEAATRGEALRIETPELVLAAGAVQTARLLLLSSSADLPQGVANGSGQVGRNFMETLSWRSTGLVEGLRGSHLGLPADAIFWGPSAPGQHEGAVGGFRLNHATAESGLTGPIGYVTRLIAGHGARLRSDLRATFGSALTVGAVGQVVADDRSRVTLDPQVKDALGLPVARIDSVLTRESLTLLRHMAESARAVLRSADAVLVEEDGSRDAFTATHIFGTARMGNDPARSVVNPMGRSHDHGNLWIVDASVFPTSGGGESPSLTIMALAIRAADALQQQTGPRGL